MFLQEGNELTAWPEERSPVYLLNLSKCNSKNLFQEYFKDKMMMKHHHVLVNYHSMIHVGLN